MTLATFTAFHTLISLIAIVAGVPVVAGLYAARRPPFWTAAFLVTAIATSVTGYFFPFHGVTPAQVVGVVALVTLALVLLARYRFNLEGVWSWVYAVGMVINLYLLVFVAIAQAFAKIGALRAIAPTQTEPPFTVTQVMVLIAFIAIGVTSGRAFHRVSRMAVMK